MSIASIPTNALPRVPLEMPTAESIRAEAAAMGDHFSEVTTHPADLLADAEEILTAIADLDDMIHRRFKVTPGLLKRIELLKGMLAPHVAELQRAATAGQVATKDADDALARLLVIRSELGKLAKAAGRGWTETCSPWRRGKPSGSTLS